MRKFLLILPIVLAAAVLAVMAAIYANDSRAFYRRDRDLPPRIEFSWTPRGPVELEEMKGRLRIEDDYGLDFTTYRMHIREIGKTIDYPVRGVIGRTFEQDIFLSWLANNPKVREHNTLTLDFSIADDRGQEAKATHVIKLKWDDPGVPVLVE
jgi:hypothetical protein